MDLTGRVKRRVRVYFRAEDAEEALAELAGAGIGHPEAERLHAAILLASVTNLAKLKELAALSRTDRRAVLAEGGVLGGDWRDRVRRELGSAGAPPGPVSARVAARVRRDFPAKQVDEVVRELSTGYACDAGDDEALKALAERIQAAAVLGAKGDLRRLKSLVHESHVDPRDTLMAADGALAHEDWPEVLRREFPEPGPRRKKR